MGQQTRPLLLGRRHEKQALRRDRAAKVDEIVCHDETAEAIGARRAAHILHPGQVAAWVDMRCDPTPESLVRYRDRERYAPE